MAMHHRLPEEVKSDTAQRIARELIKELEYLEQRMKELMCEKPVTQNGDSERQVVCRALGLRAKRIRRQLSSGEVVA